MKKKFRSALFSSMSFLLLAGFYPGFVISSTSSLALATGVYGLLHVFVRPVLKIFSIPFNLITFGMFGIFINVAVLFLLNTFVPEFKIVGFHSQAIDLLGFSIPSTDLNPFLSAVVASFVLSLLDTFLFWIVS